MDQFQAINSLEKCQPINTDVLPIVIADPDGANKDASLSKDMSRKFSISFYRAPNSKSV